VQSLSLGSKSNVQKYGLRMFNPLRNVDDTYYSSIDSDTGQPIISNIHIAKVAIRLYINLYTTNDGKPPNNIQLNFNICFDLRPSSNGDGRFVVTEKPAIPSSVLMPERTPYVQQQQAVVQSIASPEELPIRMSVVEQAQQPMVPSISTQIIVEAPSPVILTKPSNIMIQSTLEASVQILPSPIISAPLRVQISPSPTAIGTRTFDQPSSIDTEVSVVIQQQQPVVSPQLPPPVIRTIFSDRIEASATIAIVEQPVNIQRTVDTRPQQAIISPSLPLVIVETIFSPIRLAPQETILTMPSPAINAPIVETSVSISLIEQPEVKQPSIVNIPQPASSFQQQPVIASPTPTTVISTIFSSILSVPQATILTCPSPIIDAPQTVEVSATIQLIEKPIIYQPSPIETPQTVMIQQQKPIVSPSISSPAIIRTIFSEILPVPEAIALSLPSPAIDAPIQSAPQEIIITISSPVIESSPIVRTSETISIIDKPKVYQAVPIDFQPKILIQEQQQVISPVVTQPVMMPSMPEVAISTIYSSVCNIFRDKNNLQFVEAIY
ncbi:unnamed protein product, partial [Rotaria sp. Silwood2]